MASGLVTGRARLVEDDCRLADLADIVAVETDLADYRHASAVQQNVLIYDSEQLRAATTSEPSRSAVEAELVRALQDGPGVIVFAGAFPDISVVDRASDAFESIIAEQQASGTAAGDHFAASGQNDRVWNALEKLAMRAPDVFADYYANELLATVCRAWLGPAYQVTSQVNVVNPGGAAQTVHRDYHLGFQSNAQAQQFPSHVHRLSPVLTLQGAVAHTDMPVETGPTMYLPHSQKYLPGYLAWRRPEFGEHFEANHVQLPLQVGDAAFFNPALFHAAGTNRTPDVRRMANLLQISSAFGRAMESVDRRSMCLSVFPALLGMRDPLLIANVIAACAEGYAFPTNLDLDQPIGGLAPKTQAELLADAVRENWPSERLETELDDWAARRRSRP